MLSDGCTILGFVFRAWPLSPRRVVVREQVNVSCCQSGPIGFVRSSSAVGEVVTIRPSLAKASAAFSPSVANTRPDELNGSGSRYGGNDADLLEINCGVHLDPRLRQLALGAFDVALALLRGSLRRSRRHGRRRATCIERDFRESH